MAWYFSVTEAFRSSAVSLILPTQEEGEWVKSSMICWAVSCLANFFSLAKALDCPAARQITILRFILLRLSLGRSNFCSWAKEELILRSPNNSLTSAIEPATRTFRVALSPREAGKYCLFLKQHCRIVGEQIATMTSMVRKPTEKEKG